MKKILFAFFIAILAFTFIGCEKPKPTTGEITVVIINYEGEEVFKGDLSFTESDTLLKLLQDHETIKLKGETASFGFYITELVGVNSNDFPQTFWNIKVNGEDSMVGISEIKLVDKNVITFSLIGY